MAFIGDAIPSGPASVLKVHSHRSRWQVLRSSGVECLVQGRAAGRHHGAPRRAGHLTIAIEAMHVLAPAALPEVAAWLFALPCPWFPASRAFAAAPPLEGLEPLRAWARATGGLPARASRRRCG